MSENVRSEQENELTQKQEMLITALLTLPTIEAASKAVGISDRTARRWFQLPHFQAAYKAAKQIAFDDSLSELRDGVKEAISALRRNLTALEPAVQVRAAHIWLQLALETHKMQEIDARLSELEEMVKVRNV